MGQRGQDWTHDEVERTVEAYFQMLRAELAGHTYSKAARRRELLPLLHDRSEGAIEFKHGNISSVLLDLGFPYVDGYKPYPNRQAALTAAVLAWLETHPEFVDEVTESPLLNPTDSPDAEGMRLSDVLVPPPVGTQPSADDHEPWKRQRGLRIDFVRRDLENRKLGHAGEKFFLALEKRRLREAGREDLANRVEWVSRTRGDGLGFDILSWGVEDEQELYVEVKTTGAGVHFPFLVTASEVRTSEGTGDRFRLARVFRFGRRPGIYVLRGRLRERCHLEPRIWRATAAAAP